MILLPGGRPDASCSRTWMPGFTLKSGIRWRSIPRMVGHVSTPFMTAGSFFQCSNHGARMRRKVSSSSKAPDEMTFQEEYRIRWEAMKAGKDTSKKLKDERSKIKEKVGGPNTVPRLPKQRMRINHDQWSSDVAPWDREIWLTDVAKSESKSKRLEQKSTAVRRESAMVVKDVPELACREEVLSALKKLKGVGPSKAESIFEKFGSETINILNMDSSEAVKELQSVHSIGEATAQKMKDQWEEYKILESMLGSSNKLKQDHVTMEGLFRMMDGREGQKGLAAQLKKNPYLCLLNANNDVSFQTMDSLVEHKLGREGCRQHPGRVWAGVIDVLKSASTISQHSCLPWGVLRKELMLLLECDENVEEQMHWVQECIDDLLKQDTLDSWDLMLKVQFPGRRPTEDPLPCKVWKDDFLCFLRIRWEEEQSICNALTEFAVASVARDFNPEHLEALEKDLSARYPGKLNFESLSEGQRTAVVTALKHRFTVIIGWPGSGKTFCMKYIIACLLRMEGHDLEFDQGFARVCAPTGRAAGNLAAKLNLPVESSTIHRLLKTKNFRGNDKEKEMWEAREYFQHDSKNCLKYKFLGIDEASMIDCSLFSSLLAAINPGNQTVLVGDPNQLPSVKAGQVLQDIVDSKMVPVVDLREIHRQAKNSAISTNAQNLLRNKTLESMKTVTKEDFENFPERLGSDCVWLEVEDIMQGELELQKVVLDLVKKINRPKDIQVLSCERKGDAGIFQLNVKLQNLLNPWTPGMQEGRFNLADYGDVTFRTGDKVIQCKNNYKIGVYNGDVGKICRVNESSVEVKFSGRFETVIYSGSTLRDELQPAWALTVHKAQGAEFDIVIMLNYHGKMLNTISTIYTAITRASKHLIVVGTRKGMQECTKEECKQRYSGLRAKLEDAKKRHKLPNIEPIVY